LLTHLPPPPALCPCLLQVHCFGKWSTNDPSIQQFRSMQSSGLKSLAAGDYYAVGVNANGEALVCGTNFHGQLGVGHTRCLGPAVPVPFFKSEGLTVTKVACGRCHTAFLVAPGRLFMSGWYVRAA
jgi:alpha-tubulin suppressor-like RCC1 family protein